MDHTPLDPSQLSPAAQRALGPGPGRMMVARGMMPLPPADNLAVLYQLSLDSDTTLVNAARVTSIGLPEKLLAGTLGDPKLDARIIHFFALLALDKASVFDAVVMNAATADQTVATMVARCGAREVDLVATNEQRLLRHPEIIGAMYMNRRARMSTVDRVVELAVRNNVRVPGLAAWDEIARSLQGGPATPEDDAAFAAAVTAEEDASLTSGSAEEVPPEVEEGKEGKEGEGGEERKQLIVQVTACELRGSEVFLSAAAGTEQGVTKAWKAELVKTNDPRAPSIPGGEVVVLRVDRAHIIGKVRLPLEHVQGAPWVRLYLKEESISTLVRRATIGNAQDRDELIRSPIRTVAMAAVKSPAVKDVEVARWAGNQNLIADVIAYISGQREWTKMYGVKVSLCRNPKTPVVESSRMLPFLHERDLTALSKSKAVSSALVANARKLLMNRRSTGGGPRR
ncbi:MAG: hypothetical protein KIT31_06710 [Deltaproteobacteria bacterium]|nr:hypothetical protein [Deltaproteobacteria bacterium]